MVTRQFLKNGTLKGINGSAFSNVDDDRWYLAGIWYQYEQYTSLMVCPSGEMRTIKYHFAVVTGSASNLPVHLYIGNTPWNSGQIFPTRVWSATWSVGTYLTWEWQLSPGQELVSYIPYGQGYGVQQTVWFKQYQY